MQKWTKVVKYSVLPVAGGVPLVATVACSEGNSFERYDTEDDGVIRILTSFSEDGTQYKALQDMVDDFNAEVTSDFTVEITQVQGGYDQIPQDLAKNFEAGEKTKLPNLVIGYPDHLGTVAKYDMELAFDNTYDDLFSDDFMAINDNIGGLEADSGTYLYPLGKSIDMLSVNQPVLGYILKTADDKGLILDSNRKKIDEIIEFYVENGDDVDSLWIENPEYSTPENLQFDDSIFTDGLKLLDFAIEANKMFVDNGKEKTYILGIDSSVNFMYSMAFSYLNANAQDGDDYYDNFLFHIGEDGYVEYEFLDDTSSKQYKAFEEIYQKLEEALNEGAVYLNVGGAYSSDLEKNHQIGLAIGSTAGYSYNYTVGVGTFSYKIGSKTFSSDDYTYQYLLEVGSDLQDGVIGIYNPAYDNSIYEYGYYSDLDSLGSYDLQINSTYDQVKLEGWLSDPAIEVIVTSEEGIKNTVEAEGSEYIVPFQDEKYIYWIVPVSNFESDALHSLQEDELLVLNAPQTFDSSFQTSLIQGPSIFAVHNNEAEDAFLEVFLEWGFGISEDSGKSPFEEFALAAGYIFPTKNILESDENSTDLLSINGEKLNDAQLLTFEILEEISTNDDYHAFENPADDTTSNTRDVLDTIIGASFTNVENGKAALTIEEIYDKVVDLI